MNRDAAESVRRFSEAARAVVWAFQAPVRIEILLHLMETPSDVGTLAARLDLAVTHVSNHLRAACLRVRSCSTRKEHAGGQDEDEPAAGVGSRQVASRQAASFQVSHAHRA